MLTPIQTIAQEAIIFARQYIKHGLTQLDNNRLPKETRNALLFAVFDLREYTNDNDRAILKVKGHESIQHFYRIVADCKKYSLGNCGELAFLALYYISKHYPETVAQLFRLKGGNHEFVILKHNNNTWVCDPWAGKAYPISHCAARLKAYYYIEKNGTYTNHTRSFDPRKHSLVPDFSTDDIKAFNTQEKLDALYQSYCLKQHRIAGEIELLATKLHALAAQVAQKYTTQDPNYQTLQQKSQKLYNLYMCLNKGLGIKPHTSSYEDLHNILEARLRTSMQYLSKAVRMTDEQIEKLASFHHKSFKHYLHYTPRMFSLTQRSFKETEEKLSILLPSY